MLAKKRIKKPIAKNIINYQGVNKMMDVALMKAVQAKEAGWEYPLLASFHSTVPWKYIFVYICSFHVLTLESQSEYFKLHCFVGSLVAAHRLTLPPWIPPPLLCWAVVQDNTRQHRVIHFLSWLTPVSRVARPSPSSFILEEIIGYEWKKQTSNSVIPRKRAWPKIISKAI